METIIFIIVYVISLSGNIYILYKDAPKNSTIGDIFENAIIFWIIVFPFINTIVFVVRFILESKEIKIK